MMSVQSNVTPTGLPSQPTSITVQPGNVGLTALSGQATTIPHAFTTETLRDFSNGAWNMDTGASSHLNSSVNSLCEIFDTCMYPSISVGGGHSIPVTNTGHSILPTSVRPLHLKNFLITPHIVKNLIYVRQFVRDSNCTIEFDAFGFSVKDFMTRRVLLRCDSTGDLYRVTHPSPIPRAFLVSQHTWHQRLGHPGGDVLRRLVSINVIFCNNEKPPVLCHACQLGKHVRLPFEFSMTDLRSLNYFLGIFVTRDSSGIFLSQKKYAIEILEKAHMVNCNSSRTPVDSGSKLGADGDRFLIRLSIKVLQENYFSGLKRVLRYVFGALDYGLQLFSFSTTDLVAYSKADWAGCHTTRRYFCTEAEYRGVTNAVTETCWLRNLLRELHTPLSSATLVYCDNVSTVYLSSNPVKHQRTKHIEIDIHFFRDLVAVGHVRVLHVPSRYEFADIFTKGFPTMLFEEFRTSLSVADIGKEIGCFRHGIGFGLVNVGCGVECVVVGFILSDGCSNLDGVGVLGYVFL
nr:ribonuclease H-like domain-containing protein [Tanacetum cinerariifolium]